MQARLCATVTGRTTSELRARRDAARDADMIELRLDHVRDPDVDGALAGRRQPVVVTCRPAWEGGRFQGAEEERRRILERALELGADFVDVEWRAGFDDLIRARRGRNVLLSTHDFNGVPDDLAARRRAMFATGAEAVKLAVRAGSLKDTLALLDLPAPERGRSQVLVAMGPAGVASRLLPDRFGSCWTYAGDGVAPGQIGLQRMLGEFRFRAVGAGTELYGLLGAPVGHSLSPAMHNAGFDAVGRDAVYLPLEAADVEDFWAFAERLQLRGASVTAPCKEQVLAGLAACEPLVEQVGAANTLQACADGWHGRNTDVPGFLQPLEDRIALDGCRATVLGAGGVARAVAVALAGRGAQVSVCARNVEKASGVAGLIGGEAAPLPPPAGSWDLLVNTTPIGTYPDVEETPLPGGPFDGRVVYDLVYNPRETRLMAEARAAGCTAIGGLPMLVAQACRQFEWWTGSAAPLDVFQQAAERRLAAMEATCQE